ncbi:MAG: formylglycine-generating enzyme family protein [Polyangiaceae bacterium]|nr:formylglycine-generating enzyme family protein [Polyangiaceae bacterium]
MRRPPSFAVLVVVAIATISLHTTAAPPDEAPAECRAQVENALSALAPCFDKSSRKLAAGSPGTLEHAIAAYAPARFHAVSEGTLGPIISNARCPDDMALAFGRFCIDRYEASLVERMPDGTITAVSPYVTPPADGHVYLARSVKDVVPQGYISAAQSAAACKASGKRLCQPVEWRAACGGSAGYAFPYGPSRDAGRCHDSGVSPMLAYHEDTMKRGWGRDELNDPRNNQLAGGLAKTGAFPDCKNDFDVYDMVGNLHEWTADPNGTFQGGYWLDTSQHGDGCAYRTISHGYEYHDYSTGFRCCADPIAAP